MRPTILALLCLLPLGAAAQTTEWSTDQRSIRIPMRDGQWLSADVYLPPEPGKYPTVLIQTPYKKERMKSRMFGKGAPGAGASRADLLDSALGGSRRETWTDRAHYAYVVVDWRGFYGSKAAKKTRGTRGQDGYDTVEWIAARSWSNGKVGTWGGSALGKAQFDTACMAPPHLVCSVPTIAAMGMQYANYYSRGVLLDLHTKRLDQLGFGVGKYVRGKPDPEMYLWRVIKNRTYTPRKMQVPTLMVTGWWDHFPALVFETFEDIVARGGPLARAHSKIIVGPWDHMSVDLEPQGQLRFPRGVDAHNKAVRKFLDYWLRDRKDNGWAKQPRWSYYQIGEQRWLGAKTLPSASAVSWHLGDGTIAPTAGTAGARSFTHDPDRPVPTIGGANLGINRGPRKQRPIASRDDVLVYSTAVSGSPLRLSGKITVDLALSCDVDDCDVHVRLAWVRADGSAYLMSDSATRASRRGKGVAKLTPGAKVRVRVELPPVAWTVPPGHKLQLLIAGSNTPRYEVSKRKCTVTLGHGEGGSTILLPIVK